MASALSELLVKNAAGDVVLSYVVFSSIIREMFTENATQSVKSSVAVDRLNRSLNRRNFPSLTPQQEADIDTLYSFYAGKASQRDEQLEHVIMFHDWSSLLQENELTREEWDGRVGLGPVVTRRR